MLSVTLWCLFGVTLGATSTDPETCKGWLVHLGTFNHEKADKLMYGFNYRCDDTYLIEAKKSAAPDYCAYDCQMMGNRCRAFSYNYNCSSELGICQDNQSCIDNKNNRCRLYSESCTDYNGPFPYDIFYEKQQFDPSVQPTSSPTMLPSIKPTTPLTTRSPTTSTTVTPTVNPDNQSPTPMPTPSEQVSTTLNPFVFIGGAVGVLMITTVIYYISKPKPKQQTYQDF